MKEVSKNRTPNPIIIGNRIKTLRRKRNWSQIDLAFKMQVSRTCISNWENGTRIPDTASVVRLGRIFAVPVDYLYGRTEHEYTVKVPDYFELDCTKLNDSGMVMLYEFYKYLISNEQYSAEETKPDI